MAFNDNLEFSSCAVGVDLTVSQCYKCLSVTGVSGVDVGVVFDFLTLPEEENCSDRLLSIGML